MHFFSLKNIEQIYRLCSPDTLAVSFFLNHYRDLFRPCAMSSRSIFRTEMHFSLITRNEATHRPLLSTLKGNCLSWKQLFVKGTHIWKLVSRWGGRLIKVLSSCANVRNIWRIILFLIVPPTNSANALSLLFGGTIFVLSSPIPLPFYLTHWIQVCCLMAVLTNLSHNFLPI